MKFEFNKIDSYIGNSFNKSISMERPCPVCGKLEYKVFNTLNDFQFFSDSKELPKRSFVCVVQCSHCNAIYQNPVYTKYGFSVLFSEAGMSYGSSSGRAQEQLTWLNEKGLVAKGSVFLDVGCYEGEFLSKLPPEVVKVGVEIDQYAVERGQKRYKDQKIDFILGDLDTFRSANTPDTIVMFHVLEHVNEPVNVLKNLRNISHKNTKLVIEVPILENGFTNDINGFLSVQHMTHFTRNSLKNCFILSGWEVVNWQEMEEYNGCRVILQTTDKVLAVKNESSDISLIVEYLVNWYKSIANINKIIDSIEKDTEKIVVWGGGLHTEFLYQLTLLFKLLFEFIIVDSDKLKQGKSWRGINIYSPDIIKDVNWKKTKLVISTYGNQDEIANAASERGVPENSIIMLYDKVSVY